MNGEERSKQQERQRQAGDERMNNMCQQTEEQYTNIQLQQANENFLITSASRLTLLLLLLLQGR